MGINKFLKNEIYPLNVNINSSEATILLYKDFFLPNSYTKHEEHTLVLRLIFKCLKKKKKNKQNNMETNQEKIYRSIL